MDKLDYEILEIMKENSRETASNIGKRISLSVSAVSDRIRKLEDEGVTKGYTLVLNNRKLGLDVTALMEVSFEHPKYYDSFVDKIRQNPYIVDCYYLTGDFDFILKISCKSSEHLESIHKEIKSINGVSSTRTNFVLKEVKNIYTALPDENSFYLDS